MERILGRYSAQIYALMRIVIGLTFACHGAQKHLGAFGGQVYNFSVAEPCPYPPGSLIKKNKKKGDKPAGGVYIHGGLEGLIVLLRSASPACRLRFSSVPAGFAARQLGRSGSHRRCWRRHSTARS